MIELCPHYTTSGHPYFKPLCKLGHGAGLWCHSDSAPHYCGEYQGGAPETPKATEPQQGKPGSHLTT
ncbi:hypothetical protein LCGC14_1334500 [marine sediment metagenome]|uniref:Uncharacterized protein n=1 Tax=marine sediment metagenome TaxID=412755 RepID=A0A0F9MWF9_9ZZZZ